jgi:hypothetical protein
MGLTGKVQKGNILYLSVVGGNMAEASEEGVEGAVKREYETSDGKKGVKFEILHKDLTGFIVGVAFEDSRFGEKANIRIQKGTDVAQISFTTDSKYFIDFSRKLPNVDLSQEVTLNPYDFEPEEGKRLTGVSMKQGGEKVADYYWDGKKTRKGFPEVSKEERKDYDKDDWKMFFLKLKKYLKKEVQGLTIPSYTPAPESVIADSPEAPANLEAEDNDDLPF